MEIAVTKISSKGQIVIPQDMRVGMAEGEKLLLIKSNGQLIIKSEKNLEKNFEEELEFTKRSDEALEKIENGEGISMDFDEFIEEIKTW